VGVKRSEEGGCLCQARRFSLFGAARGGRKRRENGKSTPFSLSRRVKREGKFPTISFLTPSRREAVGGRKRKGRKNTALGPAAREGEGGPIRERKKGSLPCKLLPLFQDAGHEGELEGGGRGGRGRAIRSSELEDRKKRKLSQRRERKAEGRQREICSYFIFFLQEIIRKEGEASGEKKEKRKKEGDETIFYPPSSPFR